MNHSNSILFGSQCLYKGRLAVLPSYISNSMWRLIPCGMSTMYLPVGPTVYFSYEYRNPFQLVWLQKHANILGINFVSQHLKAAGSRNSSPGQVPVYAAKSTPWLLIGWLHKEPGQPLYRQSTSQIFHFNDTDNSHYKQIVTSNIVQ